MKSSIKSDAFPGTVGEGLSAHGVSRREFLAFCTSLTAMLALPPAMAGVMAEAISHARRQSVIWLSFQECTGCTESLTRSHAPTLENLIFDLISLDYHHTLQAASGESAEQVRIQSMKDNAGKYLLIVDGSIPMGNPGFSTIAGISNYDMLMETAKGAAAIVAVGTCAAYGGLPGASPNPTGAVSVGELIRDKPVINVPGCPPIPVVMTGVLAHFLTFGSLPELDAQGRRLVIEEEENAQIVPLPHRDFHAVGDFEQRVEAAQLAQPHHEVGVKVLVALGADVNGLAQAESIHRDRGAARVEILRVGGDDLAFLGLDEVAPQAGGMEVTGGEGPLERHVVFLTGRQLVKLHHLQPEQVGQVMRVAGIRRHIVLIHQPGVESAHQRAPILDVELEAVGFAPCEQMQRGGDDQLIAGKILGRPGEIDQDIAVVKRGVKQENVLAQAEVGIELMRLLQGPIVVVAIQDRGVRLDARVEE